MAARWEYAVYGFDYWTGRMRCSVWFSHDQHAGLVAEARQQFGRALREGDSDALHLELEVKTINEGQVLRFLADRGWEMCAGSGDVAQSRAHWRRPLTQ